MSHVARQPYHIDSFILPSVSSVSDLGVVMESSLKFSQHCNKLCAKAGLRARQILRCFRCKCPGVLTIGLLLYLSGRCSNIALRPGLPDYIKTFIISSVFNASLPKGCLVSSFYHTLNAYCVLIWNLLNLDVLKLTWYFCLNNS